MCGVRGRGCEVEPGPCNLEVPSSIPGSGCQLLDSPKLKFAYDDFKFDENGRKLSKKAENAVGKGEILIMSNLSFSQSVFKRLVLQIHKNQSLFGKGLPGKYIKL